MHRNIKFADIAIAFHNETSEIVPSTNLPMVPCAIAMLILNTDFDYCLYSINSQTKQTKNIIYFLDGFYYGPDDGCKAIEKILIAKLTYLKKEINILRTYQKLIW